MIQSSLSTFSSNRGGRIGQLLLLGAVALAAVLAASAIYPLQETVRTALKLSDNQVALLQGPAMAIPLTLSSIPLGLLIDRYLRARLLSVFVALTLIGSLLTAVAPSFTPLLAARCLVGLAAPAITITSLSLVADLYPPEQRGRAYMLLSFGSVLGTPAAFAWGGALLGLYGSEPEAWRWGMTWLSVPLMPALLLTFVLREPPRTGVILKNPAVGTVFAELWSYRALILPLQVCLIMVGVVDTAAMVWAMPALSRHLALSPERINPMIAAASLLSGVLGPAAGGALVDASQRAGGPRRGITVLTGLVLLSAPAGLFALAPDRTSAALLLTIFMALGNAISLTGTAIATVVIPNELRGLYIALGSTVASLLCTGAAPLVVSMQATAMGGPSMIAPALAVTCATMSLLASAALFFAKGRFTRMCGVSGDA